MDQRSIAFFAAAAALALLCGMAAHAESVVVTSGDTKGWACLSVHSATSAFKDAPDNGPLPPGAFYGACGQGGSGGNPPAPSPGQCWLGTNKYVGTPIADITGLTYSTYTYPQGIDDLHYAKQPWQLQLVIQKDPPTDPNYRTLMYRPWGLVGSADPPANPYGMWEDHDCLVAGEVWYVPEMDNGTNPPELYTGDWSWVLSQYPNGKLVTPPQGTGWDNKTDPPGWSWYTGTGCSLNFQVGARKASTKIFGRTTAYAWWRESYDFAGVVDNFTINLSDGSSTTYDFDKGPFPFINNRAVLDGAIKTAAKSMVWQFVLWGKVMSEGWVMYESFQIDDGSGQPVNVLAYGWYVEPGQHVRVRGVLKPQTAPLPTMQASVLDYYYP